MKSKLQRLTKSIIIKKPMTLDEICDRIESGDYNAQLMLNHLLVWVGKNIGEKGTE